MKNNSWFYIEFRDNIIIQLNCTIRSPYFGTNNQLSRSWVIEGSKDSKEWTIIDEQKDCSFMNGKNSIHFTFQNPAKSISFEFERLAKTGHLKQIIILLFLHLKYIVTSIRKNMVRRFFRE